ncbi:MAG: aminoacyl--tRNA ligase-related protein, partial [Candidatus Paceibacterota bacterium]
FTPKGSVIRRELERFIVDEEIRRGYLHVYTPDIAKLDLYKKSGHYPHYKDSMYAPIEIDDEQFMLRPMTCPHHFELYLRKPVSYRELPMRIAELAKLYRYEQSGELMGLQRVRTFCLSDAHIICTSEEQAIEEISNALDLIEYVTSVFGLTLDIDYRYRLSLGDRANTEKYYKNDAGWEKGEDLLRRLMQKRGSKFEEAKDEAAFYGPKIDIQMKNVNGKEDTAFTVQYDLCRRRWCETSCVRGASRLYRCYRAYYGVPH